MFTLSIVNLVNILCYKQFELVRFVDSDETILKIEKKVKAKAHTQTENENKKDYKMIITVLDEVKTKEIKMHLALTANDVVLKNKEHQSKISYLE
jgi:uncharacterized phage-like protein YoqJ